MEASVLTADYWLLATPVVGAVLNVAAQVVLARLYPGQRLLVVIVIAFGIGLAGAGAMMAHALRLEGLTALDAVALAVSVLIVYSAAGTVLFAIVNLGETSLRIRMMRMLLEAPDGISRDDLMASYDDRALVVVRLQRLADNGQARVVDDVYYSRLSILFLAAAGIRLAKRLVYGRR
jgi:hypothetical protein